MTDPIEVQARLSLANMREVVKLSKGNKDEARKLVSKWKRKLSA
jgi:hypothetical protein